MKSKKITVRGNSCTINKDEVIVRGENAFAFDISEIQQVGHHGVFVQVKTNKMSAHCNCGICREIVSIQMAGVAEWEAAESISAFIRMHLRRPELINCGVTSITNTSLCTKRCLRGNRMCGIAPEINKQ